MPLEAFLGFGLVIGAIVVIGIGYFVPTIVAVSRRHHDVNAIALVNGVLGWTFFGWFFALVWALTGRRE